MLPFIWLLAVHLAISVNPPSTGGALLEIGDSIAEGYCLNGSNPELPTNPAQFGFAVGAHYGQSVTDLGMNGYQVDTMISRELGTPSAPLVTVNGYKTVIIVGGTNDMINLHNSPSESSVSKLAGIHENLITYAHQIEPHAKIIDVGVRDLAYNDSSISNKAPYQAQIADYNQTMSDWIKTQSYARYFPIFPESSYSSYYASDEICGPWHPSLKAEPMYTAGIEALLDEIPTQ